jgi:sugar-specific transcriptional regulator TrmB
MAKVDRRGPVKELLLTGEFTKVEIAEKLGIPADSVSSQMTYLKWMGFPTVTEEGTKKLKIVSLEEYATWEAAKIANRKAKAPTSKRSPQEQANALAKTVKSQAAQLAKAEVRKAQVDTELADNADDDVLQDISAELGATISLLTIKLKRNNAALAELPEPQDAPEEVQDTPEDEDNDLL